MEIYDYLYEYIDEDFIELIKRRLPMEMKNRNIKIIHRRLDHSRYIDVSFCFEGVQNPPAVFYTHFYAPELKKYWNNERYRKN